MSNNNDKFSRRKPSFRVKESTNNDSTNISGGPFSNGFNSVRGSIRRFRRVSGTTPPTNPNSNLPTHQETALSANVQSPAFPFSRIANIAREQKSRLKEINITQKTADLTAVVQEMGTELGKKGVEFGSMAKDAVDRWKKRKEDNPPNDSLSHSSTSIFGAPLKTAVMSTRIEKDTKQIHKDPFRYWLPAITVRCMEFLDKYGLDEIGIYRIPGIKTTELRIRDIFNSGADLNFLQSSKEDPHAVAALLKMYFRELPEPLLTEALLPDFNECVTRHNDLAVAEEQPISSDLPRDLAEIVSRLPPYNFYLLRALCEHLSRVDKKSDINKMNIANLGLFFCPSLAIGSILFKAFIENIDIVFGGGCKTEEAELENEKREQEQTPLIYHKTYISEDFSKSFEDLLTLNKKTVTNPSSHSCPSSSSSSIKGYNFKDNIGTSTGDQDSILRRYVLNNTTITPTPVTSITAEAAASSILSSTSSDVTSIPNHRSTHFQRADNEANNPFSDDESLSTPNNHEQRQVRSVNIITPKNTSSFLPPFRPRSRSTGLRDVPLSKTIEFSSDSSDNEDQDDFGGAGDNPTSPTLMTFDYVDRHGAKNLGVLNLSTRAPNNWVSHGDGAGDNGSKAAPSWVRRRIRRPSLEEAEEWKRALLEDIDADTPPNVPEENDDMKDVHIGDIKSMINKINGISDSPNTSHAREKAKTCVPVGNLIDL